MDTRKEYRERTATKLQELELKVWLVKQKADQMKNEARIEYEELFQVLYSKLEHVQEHLQELDEASDETWQDFRAKVDGALSDLNNSVGNVLSRTG
jgi:hypothetical protein